MKCWEWGNLGKHTCLPSTPGKRAMGLSVQNPTQMRTIHPPLEDGAWFLGLGMHANNGFTFAYWGEEGANTSSSYVYPLN
jgi:hypothetical protein